jgi:hypothetical protein
MTNNMVVDLERELNKLIAVSGVSQDEFIGEKPPEPLPGENLASATI